MAQLTPRRAYIRRQGRMTRAQARALDTLLERYQIPLAESSIDWTTAFGRPGPLFIEIGFGMGHALLDTAKRHPEWNCVGIEVYRPGIGALLNGVEVGALGNVRVVEADARDVLANMVMPGTLHQLAVFFPDPWPKSKHHKRRLVNAEFAALAATALAQHGELLVATDWEEYANEMLLVLDAEARLENVAGPGRFVARGADRPVTRFEARGVRLGHQVWDLSYRCRAPTETR